MDITQAKSIMGEQFSFVVDDAIKILDYLKLPLKAHILDVGTGMGHCAVILALKGYHVLTGEPAGDRSVYAKQDWRENARKAGVDHLIRFEAFDAEAMPFDDARFDAIFLYGVLHHIEKRVRMDVTNECVRTVRPEGVICFFEPNQNIMKHIKAYIPAHPDPADPCRYMQRSDVNKEIIAGEFFDAFIFRKQGFR